MFTIRTASLRAVLAASLLAIGLLMAPTHAAAAKGGGYLTYTCGYNICKRAVSGGTPTKLTKGGTKQRAFAFAATSRNGKVTVYTRSGEKKAWIYVKRGTGAAKKLVSTYWGVPLGYPRINAAATTVMWNEIPMLFDWGAASLQPHSVLIPFNKKKINGENDVRRQYFSQVGFGRKNTFLSPNSTGTQLCERPLSKKLGTECGATVANSDALHRTFGPVSELTPNGKLLVTTTETYEGATKSYVSVFNVATGKHVRDLTKSGKDDSPTVSPDGTQVAYECGKHICVRPITGGKERIVVRNANHPTWSSR